MCGSVLTELLRTCVYSELQSYQGPLWVFDWPSCGLLGLGESGCELLLSCLGREHRTVL